jgi:hypothetical protein
MCTHQPICPTAANPDRDAARVVCSQPGQGWSLLCNGVVVFDDTGELLPDGEVVAPRRVLPLHRLARVVPRSTGRVALAG